MAACWWWNFDGPAETHTPRRANNEQFPKVFSGAFKRSSTSASGTISAHTANTIPMFVWVRFFFRESVHSHRRRVAAILFFKFIFLRSLFSFSLSASSSVCCVITSKFFLINLTFKNWFLPFFFIFRDSRIEILGTTESLARAEWKKQETNDAIITQLGMCCALRCFKVLSNWKKNKHLQPNFLGIWNRYAYHRTRSFVWAINMLKMACWKRWRTSFTRLEVAAKFQKKKGETRQRGGG